MVITLVVKIEDYVKVVSVHSAFQSTFQKNFYFSGERHNYWEMVWVLDGTVGITEEGRVYILEPGQLIFHKPMEFHRIWAERGTTPTVIITSFALRENEYDTLGRGVFTFDDAMLAAMKQTVSHYQHWQQYNDSASNQLIANSLERLLLDFLKNQAPNTAYRKTLGSQNYKKIIGVLNSNIEKCLTVGEIAELCCLSDSNLKKTFKKFSGMGIMEYYNSLKISLAKQMIIENELSISQISEHLGYSTPSYFAKVFKRECGYTPIQYRKKHEND